MGMIASDRPGMLGGSMGDPAFVQMLAEYLKRKRRRNPAPPPDMPPQQGQGQSVNPMQAYNIYQQFAGGGGTAGGMTGPGLQSSGATTYAAPEAGAIMGGESGAGGAAGGMSLWPLALAAIIAGNETSAKNHNWNHTDDDGTVHSDPLRPGDTKDQIRDAFTGRALHYDVERRWNPWLNSHTGGNNSGDPGWWQNSGLMTDTQIGADLGSPWAWDEIGRDDLNNTMLLRGWSKLKDLFD